MIVCRACGRDLASGAAYCEYCGTATSGPDPGVIIPADSRDDPRTSYWLCPGCEAENVDVDASCSVCGASRPETAGLSHPDALEATLPGEGDVRVDHPDIAEALVSCPGCGRETDPALPFCPHCGKRRPPASELGRRRLGRRRASTLAVAIVLLALGLSAAMILMDRRTSDDGPGGVVASDGPAQQWGWVQRPSDTAYPLSSVDFADDEHGFAVGGGEGVAIALATDDGGKTWRHVDIEASNYLTGVAFSSPTQGCITGRVDGIFTTSDGGATWTHSLDGDTGLSAIDLVGESSGWAVGDYGVIYATTDGGRSWTRQPQIGDRWLVDVDFVDADHGWILAKPNAVYRTTDGGNRWQKGTIDKGNWLWSISFSDVDHGCAVGPEGVIFTSDDGGRTWLAAESGTRSQLSSVTLEDEGRGWAAGAEGTLLATSDGGKQWRAEDSGTDCDLFAVEGVGADRAWVVGSPPVAGGQATILARLPGGAPVTRYEDVQLAFVRGGDIWLMNADGTAQRVLWRHSGGQLATSPTWSPDGERVAFCVSKDMQDPAAEVVITDAFGKREASLSATELDPGLTALRAVAWSPDGSRLAFVGAIDPSGDPLSSETEFVVGTYELEGRRAQALYRTSMSTFAGGVGAVHWRSDGGALVFTTWRGVSGDSRAAWEVDASGAGTAAELSEVNRDVLVTDVAWAPNEDVLARAAATADPSEGRYITLVTMSEGGGRTQVLVERPTTAAWPAPGMIGHVSWAPDGRAIAYDANKGQGTEIRVVGMDGSARRLSEDAGWPAWQPVPLGP